MLFLNKPVQTGSAHYHSNANADYNAIDIGGTLDLNQVTALVQQAASRLPANQQLRPGEVWGYQITVHVTERTAQAVLVRPYPYRTWGW